MKVSVHGSAENGHGIIRINDAGQLIPAIELDAVDVDYDPDQIAHGEEAGSWKGQATHFIDDVTIEFERR